MMPVSALADDGNSRTITLAWTRAPRFAADPPRDEAAAGRFKVSLGTLTTLFPLDEPPSDVARERWFDAVASLVVAMNGRRDPLGAARALSEPRAGRGARLAAADAALRALDVRPELWRCAIDLAAHADLFCETSASAGSGGPARQAARAACELMLSQAAARHPLAQREDAASGAGAGAGAGDPVRAVVPAIGRLALTFARAAAEARLAAAGPLDPHVLVLEARSSSATLHAARAAALA